VTQIVLRDEGLIEPIAVGKRAGDAQTRLLGDLADHGRRAVPRRPPAAGLTDAGRLGYAPGYESSRFCACRIESLTLGSASPAERDTPGVLQVLARRSEDRDPQEE